MSFVDAFGGGRYQECQQQRWGAAAGGLTHRILQTESSDDTTRRRGTSNFFLVDLWRVVRSGFSRSRKGDDDVQWVHIGCQGFGVDVRRLEMVQDVLD